MEIWGIKICKWIKTLRKSCKMNETFEKKKINDQKLKKWSDILSIVLPSRTFKALYEALQRKHVHNSPSS